MTDDMTVLMQERQAELIPFVEDDQWRRALAVWLSAKRPNTRRAYLRIVGDFFDFANVTPDQVTPDTVTAWKLHLQSSGKNKDTTVAQRLAGLSSFFDQLLQRGLIARNPVQKDIRDNLNDSPYGNAKPLSMAEFAAIWSQLDGGTAPGALYRALFLAYALTGRRRSELLRLRGRDLMIDGDTVKYRVQTKGGRVEFRTMPAPAWAEIQNYLRVAGRELQDDAPVFMATHATAGYVDQGGNYVQRRAGDALTGTAASEALKRAAERAGIDPKRVTLHGMRHLAAKLYKRAHGNDMRGLQQFLGHVNISTTQIYDQVLDSDDRVNYGAMADILFGGVMASKE